MANGLANNKLPNWRFFVEWSSESLGIIHGIKKIIFSGRSKYQEVDIVETYTYGKCLFLDGKLQSSIFDEWIYHEALVQPAMVTHPNPKRVLIIGGGEGATLREVLRHNTVEYVEMVDIDEEVVNLCKKYLPEFHKGSFDDPRAKLIIGDGRDYISSKKEEYDVVIIDVTDPLKEGPSRLLYTKEFYELVHQALKDDGIMVTQATSVFYTTDVFATIYNTIRSVFSITHAYHTWVPSFNSPWGFVIGSKVYDPLNLKEEEVANRLCERGVEDKLRFYDAKMHRALFALPLSIRKVVEKEKRISTDRNPVFVIYI